MSHSNKNNFCCVSVIRFLTGILYISAELTDKHVLIFSWQFTKVSDLRHLGLMGLKLKANIIDTIVNSNKKYTDEGAYKILQKLCKGQENKQEAYTKLSKALKKCGFVSTATELEKL